ncbi:MAG: MOSC domain-containing protein [Thermoanaerobaculia bacterium]
MLRRFPVEPLGGESPNEARLVGGGLSGERAFVVLYESGEPLRPVDLAACLQFQVRFLDANVVEDLGSWARVRIPDGTETPLSDPGWLAELSRRLGRPVRLQRSESAGKSRDLHLLSRPTLGFLERAYGRALETSRIRVNFLVDVHGGKAFGEDEWVGRQIRVGDGLFDVVGPSRDGLLIGAGTEAAGDLPMVEGLLHVRGGDLGVRLHTVSGQRVRVGDPVALVG